MLVTVGGTGPVWVRHAGKFCIREGKKESVIQKRIKLWHTVYDTDMYLKSSTNDFITFFKGFLDLFVKAAVLLGGDFHEVIAQTSTRIFTDFFSFQRNTELEVNETFFQSIIQSG